MIDQTPPPSVHYDMPFRAEVSGVYDCPGGEVRLTVAARRAWNGNPAHVRVSAYSVGGRSVDPVQLQRWNEWLGALSELHSSGLLCQTSDNQLAVISGVDRQNRVREVRVYWRGAQVGLLPEPGAP